MTRLRAARLALPALRWRARAGATETVDAASVRAGASAGARAAAARARVTDDGVLRVRRTRLLRLPCAGDARGRLVPLEPLRPVPFAIRRVYYVFDVPAGGRRGGHAHGVETEVMVAVSGRFVVTVDDGRLRQEVELSRPDAGLYVGPRVWHELHGFTRGAVCLVLSSEPYDAGDYVHDYASFLRGEGLRR